MAASATFDTQTLRFYAEDAARLAQRPRLMKPWGHIDAFMKRLPPGGHILDLGCGAGRDAMAFLAAGFPVTAVDGVAEMAALAQAALGQPVLVMEFSHLPWRNEFDGIWAQASLQHVPRAALAHALTLAHRALKPGGHFYASFKAGHADGRDLLGRYHNFPDEDALGAVLAASGPWQDQLLLARDTPADDGVSTAWLHVFARKSGVSAMAADPLSRL